MKETIYTTYAPSDDKTFVMKDTWNDEGDLLKTECVGWYVVKKTKHSHNNIVTAEPT